MSEREVVIVDYARSAFGRLGGGLRDFAACEIAGEIIKGLVKKSGIMERGFVDSVIAGCAHGDSKTQLIARYACLYAGLPYETSATFVEMQCGSSIMALNQAAWKIKMGMSDVAICGGTECHSQHPAFITWYIDGVKFHEESDWFSAKSGQGEVAYPAPFDQPFYMILNLAVGGSWVGYPDDSTTYADQQFAVDYVKVYQKDSYDENVEKPVKNVILREPDTTGNYINNGDFSIAENLSDDKNWKFLTTLDGDGKAEIKNHEMVISTVNMGTADYSIQLVQPDVPLQKGGTYKVTFDAYADEARTMIADISGPDHNYTRYWKDTKVELGTQKTTYTYVFQMTGSMYASNGRLQSIVRASSA